MEDLKKCTDAMAFVTTDLVAYVDQNKFDLSRLAIMGSRFRDFVTVNPGIKSSATINLIMRALHM